ncbi:molecular chaperone DnaJ [Pleurocapsales cyanobacterium LEGE 06147]|nr:molecular chaperone DnaJ [Pleurocapsales cyanobacterium LEGE 06147]
MNFADTIAQLQWQLEEIAIRLKKNQQEQAATKECIEKLEAQIQQESHRQSELDREAVELEQQTQKLRANLNKLQRISALCEQFQELATECQDNQELLQILYSSVPIQTTSQVIENADTTVEYLEENNVNFIYQPENQFNGSTTDNNDRDSALTIAKIKAALPNAEQIYRHIVARYLEQYQAFQNLMVDELDVIWCSVAFIAFGRASYRQLSFKHHPDLDGSDLAMQLINTAWEISQDYLGKINNAS